MTIKWLERQSRKEKAKAVERKIKTRMKEEKRVTGLTLIITRMYIQKPRQANIYY